MIRFAVVSLLFFSQSLFSQIIGADLSFVPRLEHNGAVYRAYGHDENPLTIFYASGFRNVRVRLWHSPDEAWHGLDSTLAFAERASAEGFQILLDLHYSDTWADPAHQAKPSAWNGLSFQTLKDSVYAYTNAVIRRFRDGGVIPQSVQIGNEITAGMLWNEGRVDSIWNTPQQWNQLCELLTTAISAIHDSLSAEQRPKIIVHVSEGGNNNFCRYFFDEIIAHQVNFEIIGLSYYPWWHGSLNSLESNVNDLAVRYGKEIQIVETAYPWTLEWNDNTFNLVGTEDQLLPNYPATPTGQANFLSAVLNIVQSIPNHLGTGLYYWEPAWVSTQSFGSAWENLALFDFDNNSLPALDFANSSSVSELLPIPSEFSFSIYPNPFNSNTTIAFELAQTEQISIAIYNLLGNRVSELSNKNYPAGRHSLIWSASGFASGLYWIRLTSPHFSREQKALLLR